jgi:hypothetical protein
LVDKLVPEIRNYEFHTAILHIKDTIEGLPESQRSWSTKECVSTIIPDALNRFNRTNDYVLIKDDIIGMIDNCIAPLKYSYECLIARVKVRNYVSITTGSPRSLSVPYR